MWKLQTIQAIWFPSGIEFPDAGELFQAAFGAQADNLQRNRTISPASPFLSQASGEIEGLGCSVTVQPGRIALAITPVQQELDLSQPFLSIDQVVADQVYRTAIGQLSMAISDVVRNATVATYTRDARSYDEAAGIIFSDIGAGLPSDGLSDVEFQLNRRITAVDGIKVNRLLRLNVLALELVVGNEKGRAFVPNSVAQGRNATSLLVDINNVPDHGILAPAIQAALFDTYMRELARMTGAESVVRSLWDER